MGCGHGGNKNLLYKNPKNESFFEPYEEMNPYTFNISMYNLSWKKKPDICYFQIVTEEVAEKSEMKNLNIILEKTTVFPTGKLKYSINQNHILFYIFCSNGVIITRNQHKINYYITNYLDNIITLAFVDISQIIIPEKEFFSLYELKRQSKYFFSLNMKEVDFSNRNKLTNEGKIEQLSDFEDALEEDEIEEKKDKSEKDIDIRININHFNGEYMKNEDNDFLGIKNLKKKESLSNGNLILDINSILNKNKNNKLLKEIKDYDNKDNGKGKSKKLGNKKESELIGLKKNKSNKILNTFNHDKNNKNLNKTLKIGNNNLLTSNKYKEKTGGKFTKNSNSKEKFTLLKSDKLLFKNKKELNRKKNINIKVYPNKKEISTKIYDSIEKKDSKLLNFNDTNKNLLNINENNNDNINKSINEEIKRPPPSPFKIKDNILIISVNELTKETNSEIQKILYSEGKENSIDNDDINYNKNKLIESSYDHINYYYEDKKKGKKSKIQSIIFENIIIENNKINIKDITEKENKKTNDYIIIYSKNRKPFEKKVSSHKINIIYFTNCKFTIESIYYFKELISMLVKYEDLKKIYFHKNEINSHFFGWKILKQLFRENFNIRWITFKNSNLNDSTFESIISSLVLKRIRYLNFSNNHITNKSMYLFNTFLIKNQTLITLDLSHNPNISKDGIRPILISLKLHPNIYKIDLSYMQLTGSGEYIATLLYENKSIHILILKNDKLNNKDVEFIAKELIKMDTILKHLDLSENVDVGTEGLKEIGKIIYNNKSLKSMALDGMNLSINNYLPIFNGISKNKNIEYYSMSKNEGLPLKGILNFLLKNPQVKKINIIPWDREKEEEDDEEENGKKQFNEKEIFLLEKFHLKAPNIILEGINFIDN